MRVIKSAPDFTQTLDVTITEKRIGQLLHSTTTLGQYKNNKGYTFEFVSTNHSILCTYLAGYTITFEYTYHPPQLAILAASDAHGKYADWVQISRWAEQFDIPIVPLVYIGPITSADYHTFTSGIPSGPNGYIEGYIVRTSRDEFYKVKTPWYQDISQRAKTLRNDAAVWKMVINNTLDHITPFLGIREFQMVSEFEREFYRRLHTKSQCIYEDIIQDDSEKIKTLDSLHQNIYIVASRAPNCSKDSVLSVLMSTIRKYSDNVSELETDRKSVV